MWGWWKYEDCIFWPGRARAQPIAVPGHGGGVLRGFELDAETGDIVLENGRIRCVEGAELAAQSVAKLLNTNRGEWWLNREEGLDFRTLLAKKPNYDLIQNEIQAALLRLDETFSMLAFSHRMDGRRLHIAFTAQARGGEPVTVQTAFG